MSKRVVRKPKNNDVAVTIPTKDLKRVLQDLKPALAADEYVEAAACFCFQDNLTYAFNGVMGIVRPTSIGINGAASGELLYRAVTSMSGKDISVSREDKILSLKCGRSSFKTGLLSENKMVMDSELIDVNKAHHSIPISAEMLDGIGRCMVSMEDNQLFLSLSGASVFLDGKKLTICSTDNKSISRYICRLDKAPGIKGTFVIPKPFCAYLLGLKSYAKSNKMYLDVSGDMTFIGVRDKETFNGKIYSAFTRTALPDKVLDFDSVIKKNLDKVEHFEVSAKIVNAFERAQLLLIRDDLPIYMDADGKKLTIRAESPLGSSKDVVMLKKKAGRGTFLVNPDMSPGVFSANDRMAFAKNCITLSSKDGSYVYLHSYKSSE